MAKAALRASSDGVAIVGADPVSSLFSASISVSSPLVLFTRCSRFVDDEIVGTKSLSKQTEKSCEAMARPTRWSEESEVSLTREKGNEQILGADRPSARRPVSTNRMES